ncbi:MAG: hypothetical protein QMD09_06105 [Desulfatibacillaceae bacterium]|nr:hypothetical protein [Desulfatibacillaceae bacterium]
MSILEYIFLSPKKIYAASGIAAPANQKQECLNTLFYPNHDKEKCGACQRRGLVLNSRWQMPEGRAKPEPAHDPVHDAVRGRVAPLTHRVPFINITLPGQYDNSMTTGWQQYPSLFLNTATPQTPKI